MGGKDIFRLEGSREGKRTTFPLRKKEKGRKDVVIRFCYCSTALYFLKLL